MTYGELISEAKWKIDHNEITLGEYKEMIKPLNRDVDVLDRIRAEIKAMFPPSGSWMYEEGHEVEHTVCELLSDVLQIIDKYKAENEVEE